MEEIMYPLFALLGGVIITLITGKMRKNDISRAIGIASLIAAIVLLGVFYPFNGGEIFNELFVLDSFGGFFIFFFLGLAIVVLIGSMKLLDKSHEMVALILISVIGMAALSISNDIIMLFVAWEIMSISTYVLAGLGKRKESTESAMKYFIYGIVSSALVLFALSLVYGLAGTTKIDLIGPALQSALVSNPNALGVIALAATILVFGFGYKMGMVPFHLWLPDVYEGAPAPVAGYLAGVTKKVALVAAARIFLTAITKVEFNITPTFSGWSLIFSIFAVVTMTVGNVAAIAQKKVVRMFAYSSISQVGYILIGFTVLDGSGLAASMMQITMHAISTIGIFATIGILRYKYNLETVEDYKGLARRNPLIGTGLAILMLSLAGIPPFGGFLSKLFLFDAAVKGNLLWLAIVGVLNSVLSLGYYLPLIRNMFLEKGEKREKLNLSGDIRLIGPVTVNIIAAVSMMVLPIFAQALFDLLQAAAGAIF